jgi:hypothetical protein
MSWEQQIGPFEGTNTQLFYTVIKIHSYFSNNISSLFMSVFVGKIFGFRTDNVYVSKVG